MDIQPLGISREGCRTDYFGAVDFSDFDLANKRITISLEARNQDPLPPGSGDVLKIEFLVPETCRAFRHGPS